MPYPFSLTEIDLLLSYLNAYPKDAVTLSEHCLQLLKEGSNEFEIDEHIHIPEFPSGEIKLISNQLIISRKDIIDFFVVFKTIESGYAIEATIDELWRIKYKSKFKGKTDNENEHLLILCNRYYKRDFFSVFREDSDGFWSILSAFANTLAFLELTVGELLESFLSIFLKANNDGTLLNKIPDFAKEKPVLALEVFDEIVKSESTELLRYLGVLAEGLSTIYGIEKFSSIGVEFALSEEAETIWSGLDILGRLEYAEGIELNKALDLVCKLQNSNEGNIRFKAVSTLLILTKYSNNAQENIVQLANETDDNVVYPIVSFLWRNKVDGNTNDWLSAVAFNIISNPVSNHNSIRLFELYIQDVYQSGEKDYALEMLDIWIRNGQNIDTLESCFKHLAQVDYETLIEKYTYWLASKNAEILHAFLKISAWDFNSKLHLNSNVLDKFDVNQVKLIISAIIGFVFMKEPLALLLLSILDSKHIDAIGQDIQEIFVGYVCYTYPSTLEKIIKPEANTSKGKKKTILKRIIKEVDGYFEKIKKLPSLKEFSGSDIRRGNYQKAFDKLQQETFKKADDKSIFSQLAKNITLRTGRVWFCKVNGEYGNEGELSTISTSFEPPRAEFIDPTNFEFYRIQMRQQAIGK